MSWDFAADGVEERLLHAPAGFSLAETCAPVAWSGGRSPDLDWIDDRLVWVGWEARRIVWRVVRQHGDTLIVSGTASDANDGTWATSVLGTTQPSPRFSDPVIRCLARRFPGLRSFSYGSLYAGLVTAVVGQSISVAAAATVQTRLSLLFNDPVRIGTRLFVPLPRPDQLAAATVETVRSSGVTMRRANALVSIAQLEMESWLPDSEFALAHPIESEARLREIPGVGPWTARSALLWGLGSEDAFPTGDVALLRSARAAYRQPELDLRGLDQMSERWHPARGSAARLLWTDMLGVATNRC